MKSCSQVCANIVPFHRPTAKLLYQLPNTWCTATVHYLHLQTIRNFRASLVFCVRSFVLSIRLLKEVFKLIAE